MMESKEKNRWGLSSIFNSKIYTNTLKLGGLFGLVYFTWIFRCINDAMEKNPLKSVWENAIDGTSTFYANTLNSVPSALSALGEISMSVMSDAILPGVSIASDYLGEIFEMETLSI